MSKTGKTMAALAALALAAAAGAWGAGAKQDTGTAAKKPEGAPATWIADRTVVIQVYVDDIGEYLPDDQVASMAFAELKRRTGIQLEIRYTPGSGSRNLAAQLGAGTIPDVIVAYLNNSTRPEFPILYKAARDGMFADLSSYFAGSAVYKRYLEPDYLPNDTRKNIMWRDDFKGAVYLVHLAIAKVDRSLEFDPQSDYVGGAYLREDIANALGVDVTKIRTADDFYTLLTRIKSGGFKDANGNAVTPLGPKFFGGSIDALDFCMPFLKWGVSDGYNVNADGTVLHEAETEWAWRRVAYIRKLLAEGLMDKEFFTMDTTRALEYYTNGTGAVMGDNHNFTPLMLQKGGYVPLTYLDDWQGDNRRVTSGKGGYGVWAVNADAKNPQEIFALMDYLSTDEGQLFGQYGIEGTTFTRVNGQPRVTPEVGRLIQEGDDRALINRYGFGFGGYAVYFWNFVQTNTDYAHDFGEQRPGAAGSTYANATAIGERYPMRYRLVPGLAATAYLNAESLAPVKEKLSMLNYKETLQQAAFAQSDAEAQKILESFRAQLQAAGVKQFETYLEQVYKADPKSVQFY